MGQAQSLLLVYPLGLGTEGLLIIYRFFIKWTLYRTSSSAEIHMLEKGVAIDGLTMCPNSYGNPLGLQGFYKFVSGYPVELLFPVFEIPVVEAPPGDPLVPVQGLYPVYLLQPFAQVFGILFPLFYLFIEPFKLTEQEGSLKFSHPQV